jgi:hypothetical protein
MNSGGNTPPFFGKTSRTRPLKNDFQGLLFIYRISGCASLKRLIASLSDFFKGYLELL